MPTVRELSDPYANFMLNPPAPSTADTCSVCLPFTDGFGTCYRCGHNHQYLDAVLLISYSTHLGQLHTALYQYKRGETSVSRRFQVELSAVLWRFAGRHEACLARHVGVTTFDVVTTVPSSSAERDRHHPLPQMVASVIEPTRARYERLLSRSASPVAERAVDPQKYEASRELGDQRILLIDDTWTTGANAQSAAAALKGAGASAVGLLVVGRHIHDDFSDNERRLRASGRPFDWTSCAFE